MIKRHRKFTSSHVEELKRKKQKALKFKLFAFFIFLIIMTAGLSFLSKWDEISIQSIEISGNKVLDKADLEDLVQKKLSGNYFFLFSKSNVLLTSRKDIKKELMSTFRRIGSVEFDSSDLQILKITIAERSPKYTWCGNILQTEPEIPEESRCEFMDIEGYVFDKAPYFSGSAYLKFYGALDGYNYGGENWSDLISFVENLKVIGVEPVVILLNPNGEVEVHLSSSAPVTESPKIIFDYNSDWVRIYENLNTALKTEPLKTDFYEKYNSLLYLDLRFDNKVVFKFK